MSEWPDDSGGACVRASLLRNGSRLGAQRMMGGTEREHVKAIFKGVREVGSTEMVCQECCHCCYKTVQQTYIFQPVIGLSGP